MINKQDSTGFTVQVLAGGLAAITAALLGSTLGVAGTVLGAGIASVVTTIAASFYLRSIHHTRAGVQRVQAKVIGPRPEKPEVSPKEEDELSRRPRWRVLMTGAVLAFALGMLAITGVEWITGHQVSGGQGTTIGGIVRPNSRPGPVDRPENNAPSTQPSLPTVTSTAPAPSTTGVTTTSSPPTSGSTTESPAVGSTTTGLPTTSSPPPSGVG